MDARKRILIVDDDEAVLFVLHDTLVELGQEYEVVTSHNCREALNRIVEGHFDLVMTDLRMPGGDGIELTKAIKHLSADTIVIWITAYGCDNLRNEAIRLKVFRCMNKPVEAEEIQQSVRLALEAEQKGSIK